MPESNGNWVTKLTAVILTGIVAAGGALIAVATELPPGSRIGDISGVTWLVIGLTFAVAAAKDGLRIIGARVAGVLE